MSSSDLKRKTARGLMWGGIGNGAMQLLSLLFGIFLSRLLSPADYGVVGVLTIFLAMAGMLSESGFLLALVNKREIDREDYNSVFWFNLGVGVLCYAVLFFAAPFVADFYKEPEIIPLLRFLSLGFVISASATAPTAYLFRNLMVKERSRTQIAAIIVSGAAGVGCAVKGLGYWSLAIQNVLYITVNSALLWFQTPWRPSMGFAWSRIRALLPFSLKQLAVTFFNHVNNNVFAVLLGRFYGMKPAGYFSQGNKWTTMGSQTVRGMIDSVGQPVLREASADPERLQRVFGKLLRFTAFVSFPCMLGLGLISHELIVLTITDKWLPAVRVMQILAVGGAFVPVVTLYGNLFNSLNRPDIYMWNTILPGALQLAALCVTYRFGLNVMLAVYVCINVSWLAVWQLQAKRCAGITVRSVVGGIAPYLVIAAAVMGAAAFAASFAGTLLLSLIIKIGVAASLYILLMWRLKSTVFKESLNYIFKKKCS